MKRILSLAFAIAALTPALAYADDDKKPSDTAQVINHAIDKASDGLTQIAHALSSAAPQAWALACKGVFATGAASLIVGAVFLLGLIPSSYFAYCAARKVDFDKDETIPYAIGAVIFGVISVIFLMNVCMHLASADAWARVISPDGYLAQSILTKALN